ncbi:MAG: hypothetical protein CL816_06410 [Coxiellaceae bacterium]|nr:hypothetical protein [Coxiellaceae bacterium]
MSSKVNYTLVGLFVVIFAFISLFLFFWLHYKGGRTVYNTYVMYVHDDVTGLSVQSPVRYTGVPVGYVENINLDSRNPQLVRIMLKIKAGAPILTSTVATLSVQGITGSAYVALEATSDNAPLLKPKAGQAYPVIQTRPSLLNKLTNALPDVADNLQILTARINDALNQQNLDALSKIMSDIQHFTSSLSASSPDFSKIVDSVNETMRNAAQGSRQLPDLINKTNKAMSDINDTVNEIDKATRSFKEVLGSTSILLSNTTQQLLPTTYSLVQRFNTLSVSLQNFTNELSRNPSMLIRGRIAAQPGPGESK